MMQHGLPGSGLGRADPNKAGSAKNEEFANRCGNQNHQLARALLRPFEPIPKTLEEIKTALVTPPLRKIPLGDESYNLLWTRTDMTCKVFVRETPEFRARIVTSPVENAIFSCLYSRGSMAEGGSSTMDAQRVWDMVFSNFLQTLTALAGVGDVHADCDTDSSSGDYSQSTVLHTYGKEVAYLETDARFMVSSETRLLNKFKGCLDPVSFKDMKYVIGVATDLPRYHVLAVCDGKRDSLMEERNLFQATGFVHAVLLSINFLRMAVTWADVFRLTARKKEFLPLESALYGSWSQIKRTIKRCENGVRKTIEPWGQHEYEGFTSLEYVEKAYRAIGKLTRKMPVVDMDKYTVWLALEGEHQAPGNCEELRACLTDVLTILSKLHNVGIVYRDLGWHNILFVESENRWILIDYETVWEADEQPGCQLGVVADDVLEEGGAYSKKSDLKLVAKLLHHQGLTFTCQGLDEYRRQLLEGSFTDAAAALTSLPETCDGSCHLH